MAKLLGTVMGRLFTLLGYDGANFRNVAVDSDGHLQVDVLSMESPYIIRAVFTKAGISDNVATAVFSITTTDEGSSASGGAYSVFMHWLVTHGVQYNKGGACKSLTAQFCRTQGPAGAGVNSAVSEVVETASAAPSPSWRDVGEVTVTVTEVSEFVVVVNITIDMTGSSIVSGTATVMVELVWEGFLHPPVLAAA